MRSVRALLFLVGLIGCSKDPVPPAQLPVVRLARDADGRVRVETSGFPAPLRAIELHLNAEGDAVVMDAVEAATGLALDTTKLAMHGAQEAILFASDKRGVRLPPSGVIARFAAHEPSSAGVPSARLKIGRAVVVDTAGNKVEVELGQPLSLR